MDDHSPRPPAAVTAGPAGWAVRTAALLAAAVAFALIATANSGGYRFGVSDQGFYGAAIARAADPALYPRDHALLDAQVRLWPGVRAFAWVVQLAHGNLQDAYFLIYALTLVILFGAAVSLARAARADWRVTAVFLALLTLRHRIPRTGANSLEGYMHPRMFAFAIGVGALACLVGRRRGLAALLGIATVALHTTTGLWFGIVLVVAGLWASLSRVQFFLVGAMAAVAGVGAAFVVFPGRLVVMDPAWLAVIGDRDYLFAMDWPLRAWLLNLAYPAAIVLILRRRRALGVAVPAEGPLLAGLLALVAIFVASVPFTAARLALAVQMQIDRVFWILDVVAALYVAWWIVGDLASRWSPRGRTALVAAIAVAAAARGAYLVRERPLFQIHLAADGWTDVTTWIRRQPGSTAWHVLADPSHAWRYGPTIRLTAMTDTLLEGSKDPALAIYSRDVAMRVAERGRALSEFENFTTADIRALDARFALDVFVDRANRTFDLPILYRNPQFVVYDLR